MLIKREIQDCILQHFCFQSVLHVPQKPVTSGKDETDEEWSSLSEDEDKPDGQQDMEEKNTEERQENEDVADISNILEDTVLYSDEENSSADLTDYEPLPELTEEKGNNN